MSDFSQVEQALNERDAAIAKRMDLHFLELDKRTKSAAEELSDRLGSLEQKSAGAFHLDDGPAGRRNKHSLGRVLAALADPRSKVDGYEAEWSQEFAAKSGLSMPGTTWIPLSQKTVDYGSISPTAGGSNLVATELHSNEFIDILRQQSIVLSLGPRFIPATGNISVPKQSTGATAYWVSGDGQDITLSTPTYTAVSLQPKFCTGYVKYTYKMGLETGGWIEQVIMQDLAAQIAAEIDNQCINGDGSGSKITGILNTAGINATTWASSPSVPVTWADCVEAEKMLLDDKALTGNLHYLVGPALWKQLKTISKVSSDVGAGFLLDFQNGTPMLNGYPCHVSSHVPAETLIFGNFNELLVGNWGAIGLASDPYSDFASGSVGVRAMLPIDLAVRHAVSFCKIT